MTGIWSRCLFIAIASGAMFWLVSIYANGLRDPRYLDGWLLTGGMGLQLSFHVAVKARWMKPVSRARLRGIHILLGIALIFAFVSHTDVSWPDTIFECALWAGFVLVTISGLAGAWLTRTHPRSERHGRVTSVDPAMTRELHAARRAELVREVHDIVTKSNRPAAIALLTPPYDAWIEDLNANRLRRHFSKAPGFVAALYREPGALRQLLDEIDDLARYVDTIAGQKLAAIRELVLEKDRIDRAWLRLRLARCFFYVHVAVTHALIVLTLLHIVVAYSFSAGAG